MKKMAQLFLSFLGTSDYIPANYYLNDMWKRNVRFVQEATIEFTCKHWNADDRIVFLLTDEAYEKNWLDNGHIDYKTNQPKERKGLSTCLKELSVPLPSANITFVSIPIGNSVEQLYEIFEAIIKIINPGDSIYFDITHAFRSLPLLAIIILQYVKIVKDAELKGLYYGAFEVLGSAFEAQKIDLENRNVPIFDLTPFYSLIDWTIAVNNFKEFGRAESLLKTTERELLPMIKMGDKEQKKIYGQMRGLISRIKGCLLDIRTCRGKVIKDLDGSDILRTITEFEGFYLPAMIPLMEIVKESLHPFDQPNPQKKEVRNGWAAIDWCIKHNLVQQGFTLLREFMICYVFESFKLSIKAYFESDNAPDPQLQTLLEILDKQETNIREAIIKNSCYAKINDEYQFNPKQLAKGDPYLEWIAQQIDTQFISNDFAKLFTSFTQSRNDINHAGFKSHFQNSQKLSNQLQNSFNRWTEYLEKQNWVYKQTWLELDTLNL